MSDISESYAPVSGLPLVRAFLSIANKYNLHLNQLDVETVFLYGDLSEEIFMDIPDGVEMDRKFREKNVWKLEKSL